MKGPVAKQRPVGEAPCSRGVLIMKRISIFLLVLTGCPDEQPAERYGVIGLLGRDTITVESVIRRGNSLTSDAVDRFPRVRQRHTEIDLSDDGRIRRLVMDIHTPSEPENQRDRRVEVEVKGEAMKK